MCCLQFGTPNYMAPETILDMSGGFDAAAPKFKVSVIVLNLVINMHMIFRICDSLIIC